MFYKALKWKFNAKELIHFEFLKVKLKEILFN